MIVREASRDDAESTVLMENYLANRKNNYLIMKSESIQEIIQMSRK